MHEVSLQLKPLKDDQFYALLGHYISRPRTYCCHSSFWESPNRSRNAKIYILRLLVMFIIACLMGGNSKCIADTEHSMPIELVPNRARSWRGWLGVSRFTA